LSHITAFITSNFAANFYSFGLSLKLPNNPTIVFSDITANKKAFLSAFSQSNKSAVRPTIAPTQYYSIISSFSYTY
jgi:hypothetical protein